MMINEMFTMNDKHTQPEHELYEIYDLGKERSKQIV